MLHEKKKTKQLKVKVLGGSPGKSEYGCKSNEVVSCSVTGSLKQEAKVIHSTI